MAKVKTIEMPQERLELAKRYLENAREELKKAGIIKETNTYRDYKYVSSASGLAFRGVLEALKALFLSRGIFKDNAEMNRKLKKHEIYFRVLKGIGGLGKDRDNLMYLLEDVYDILHIGGYYRELRDKKSIDSGFEKSQRILSIVEKHINSQKH